MLKHVFWMILISALPLIELRGAMPYGVFVAKMEWWAVFLLCFVPNVIAGMLAYELMAPVFFVLRKWAWFERRIWPFFERKQDKLKPYVEKYGELGVAVFIGVPLPGTGAYTGAVGSYLLGLKRRKFYLANFIGVLCAGIAVMCICVALQKGVIAPDSWIQRLFIKK